MTVTNTLEQQLPEITKDPALDNNFYREWTSRRLGIEELEIFVRNYGAWVKSFPNTLAILILTTDDLEAKSEYVKTLYSEMGYGHASKAHSVLLDVFFDELSARMGEAGRLDRGRLEGTVEMLPSTQELINGQQFLYGDPQMSIGAQLALEWQAYTMLRQLYDGARNYLSLWSNPDEFHEACEYFYTHIGAAEKDHKEESLHALRRYAVNDAVLERISEGYRRQLDLLRDFWAGLYEATAAAREKAQSATVES